MRRYCDDEYRCRHVFILMRPSANTPLLSSAVYDNMHDIRHRCIADWHDMTLTFPTTAPLLSATHPRRRRSNQNGRLNSSGALKSKMDSKHRFNACHFTTVHIRPAFAIRASTTDKRRSQSTVDSDLDVITYQLDYSSD